MDPPAVPRPRDIFPGPEADLGRGRAPDLSHAVALAQAGDETAFRAVYRDVQPRLMRYLRGLVGDEAEDVASEAWGQIARDLGSFQGDGDAFRGWAATVARHRALDHIRRARRRPATTEAADELRERGGPDDTEALAMEALGTDAAIDMIAALPREQAEAVLLRVVMGLDTQTAAQVLGKRPGAVRTAAHRGLRRLAAQIEQARTDDAAPSPVSRARTVGRRDA